MGGMLMMFFLFSALTKTGLDEFLPLQWDAVGSAIAFF